MSQTFLGQISFADQPSSTPTVFIDPTSGTLTCNVLVANSGGGGGGNGNINQPSANAVFSTLQLTGNGGGSPYFNVATINSADYTYLDNQGAFVRLNGNTSVPIWGLGTYGAGILQNLVIDDSQIAPISTADRLIVRLPNTNDIFKVDYRGAIMRQNASTSQANWILGAPEANSGSSFRINTSQPNLQLYSPDSGGAVALYNTANSAYSWYVGTAGDAQFRTVQAGGAGTQLTPCQYTELTGATGNINIAASPYALFDWTIKVNAPGQQCAITLPADGRQGQNINVLGSAFVNFSIINTTSASAFQFRGGGQYLGQINLSNCSSSGGNIVNRVVKLTFQNTGLSDDWVWFCV